VAAPELVTSASRTDEELVGSVLAGDESAFEMLYERYFPRIYQFVDRRLSNRADTEETVQEVFINVFSSIESYRGEAPFAAWVFGLTRRTIAGRFKKKRHPTVPLDDGEDESSTVASRTVSGEPTPLETYEYRERVVRMDFAVRETLSAEQRRLFELHHLEDRSISEIAHELDKTENAVKSNLYRTRKLLLATR